MANKYKIGDVVRCYDPDYSSPVPSGVITGISGDGKLYTITSLCKADLNTYSKYITLNYLEDEISEFANHINCCSNFLMQNRSNIAVKTREDC